MSSGFQVTRDLLTPGLKAMARRVSNCRPVLEAMGLALVSVTRRASCGRCCRTEERRLEPNRPT